jgi:hypothetical protein
VVLARRPACGVPEVCCERPDAALALALALAEASLRGTGAHHGRRRVWKRPQTGWLSLTPTKPLSESLYGRIWHRARAAVIPGLAGTWPVRRPYDLRHAALSLAGLRRLACRGRCPRRAQRACPAHRVRPLHPRPRPDRQPAHRASPPLQPLALGWPTKIHADAGNFVRHASVPQLDSTGYNWT